MIGGRIAPVEAVADGATWDNDGSGVGVGSGDWQAAATRATTPIIDRARETRRCRPRARSDW
jgi:hypothetical protein